MYTNNSTQSYLNFKAISLSHKHINKSVAKIERESRGTISNYRYQANDLANHLPCIL